MERAALYARIDERIDEQMASGWLDEVRGLRERGYGLEHAALSGLGYGELMHHLDGRWRWTKPCSASSTGRTGTPASSTTGFAWATSGYGGWDRR